MNKRHATTIRLEEPTAKKLKEYAKHLDTKQSEIIREAIEDKLSSLEKSLLKKLALGG